MSIRIICFGMLLGLSGFFVTDTANAQEHPYYLQAISDLGAARGMLLQHIDGKPMTHNDKEALRQINEVIREVNEASITAAKAPGDQQKAPESQNDAACLQQCIDFLQKAKDDFNHEQDSHFANGLRDRSISNCDEAIKFVKQTAYTQQNN